MPAPEELLQALAERSAATINDDWGRSTVRVTEPVDTESLERLVAQPELSITGFFGEDRLPLTLDHNPPDARDAGAVAALAANERVAAQVTAASRSVDIVRLVEDHLAEVEVSLQRRAWMRTSGAFLAKTESKWLLVAERLEPGLITIGSQSVTLHEVAAQYSPGSLRVLEPAGDASGSGGAVVERLSQIADAAAWSRLAARVERADGELAIALIEEEPPRRRLTLTDTSGGVSLLKWVTSTEDANRGEALRHVMTLVAATATTTLPNAPTVRKLAERQRIAFTRDQAAEVQRAIAEGQRDAAEGLRRASEELGELLEETTKTANTSIVAIIGLVVLIARDASRLPAWLVAVATAAAVIGIAIVIRSRWTRIADQESALRRLSERLRDDPLLPADDRAAAQRTIDDFSLAKRARSARRAIAGLGGGSSAVAVAAAAWLIWLAPPPPAAPTGSPNAEVKRPAVGSQGGPSSSVPTSPATTNPSQP